MKNFIPFNKPYLAEFDSKFINNFSQNISSIAGDGSCTKDVHTWLEKYCGCKKALMTHSCTAALEMASILMDIKAGDEVIMPSYTFVSTANAIVLRGGIPRFVDIRLDTLNIDENLIERAINKKTRAIVPVHYAGVSCEMDKINKIANENNLFVLEDAAQGVMSNYKGKPLGSLGHFAAFSFHETKNIISGEGGALIINDQSFVERAEIIREKGTNRSLFIRGEVDKYSWCDIGSSYLPSDIIAAFLLNQLKISKDITSKRLAIWRNYHNLMEPLEKLGLLERPTIPKGCNHNGHIYYVLVEKEKRNDIIKKMRESNIQVTSHYVPLHSSEAGLKYSKTSGLLKNTIKCANSIIRLPIWIGIEFHQQEQIVKCLENLLRI